MRYLLWVGLTLFYNYLLCRIAVAYGAKNFAANYALITLCSIIPTWSLASYFSKNLVFDSLLYDSVLVLSSIVFFAHLGQTESFSWHNWLGVCFAAAGLLLIRV